MPSREPELYKDKIEVSLDGRRIFYLFFGGAVVVGLVFVLGVMIGRRVEARGHVNRAETQTARDPLAALDRLERADHLSFRGALTGAAAPTDVEKAIGELEKRRAAPADKKAPPAEAKPEIKPEAKPDAKPEAKPETKPEAKAEPVTHPDGDRLRADKHDDKKKRDDAASDVRTEARADRSDARRSDAHGDKPVTRPDTDTKPDAKVASKTDGKSEAKADAAKTESKPDAKAAEAKVRFTLQLSSFQDRSEAEAFLSSVKSAGFQPYLTEAEVGGKGTFYRVRLGSYRSLDAANDAKEDYEKAARKTAQVMRL